MLRAADRGANGVISINTLSGNVTLAAGTNITLTPSGNTITIAASGGGAVTSVSNSDGTLTISPTTGDVIASLNLAHINTWTVQQNISNSDATKTGFVVTNSGNIGSDVAHFVGRFGTTLIIDQDAGLVTSSASSSAFGGAKRGGSQISAYGGSGIAVDIESGQFFLNNTGSYSDWSDQGILLRSASGTVTNITSTGTVSAQRPMYAFGLNTIAATSATVFTNAPTVYIKGAPAAGSNVTITNAWGLYVDNGANSYFDGKINSGNVITSSFSGSSSTMQAALGMTVVGTTSGNFYGIGVQKTGVQEFYFGINKNGTTNSIPASACFITTYTSSGKWTFGRGNGAGQPSTIDIGSTDGSGNIIIGSKITSYNGVAAVGNGVPAIYGQGRSTAQAAAVASVATYTVGAADGSFLVSANVNVTAFAVGTFNVTVTYTDETNTSQTLKMNFSSLTGTIGIAIAATGPFEGIPAHIRCKAATAITIATSGTFTSLTYNVEGYITQLG